LYDIEVQQEAEVKSIDADKKIVKLSNGNEILYDKLLLATGSSANLSPKLKIYLKNFDNFFTLRSADDHTAIKKKIEEANEIVILGVGFIGLEVASAIITTWPAKKVTLISRDEEPMSNVLGKEIANQLLNALKAKGVRIFKGSKNHKIESKLGDLVNVSLPNRHTHAGKIVDQEIKTDLILVASGASPRTSYVPQNLVNPDGSIRVNSHLQTEDSSIYAAGDIAEFPSLLTEDRQRVEHWAVAQQQGRLAALNMLEKGQHYVDVPFFWSRQLASIGFAGFSKGHDWSYTETKLTENVNQTSRITYFYKGERCIGIAAVNWHGAVQRLKIALHRGLMPTKNELLNKTAHYETIAEKVKNSNPCRGNCCH
jgi:apoptosis-inducing factor 3